MRGLLLAVVVACAGMLPAVARAEMPLNRDAPAIEGRAAVGEVLLGHNGTWLYADGAGCGPECTFSFRWERCSAVACAVVGANRGYRVRLGDLRRTLLLTVTVAKYDCGAWNNAAGVQECAYVTRAAGAQPVFVRTRARVAAAEVEWPARLLFERASERGGLLRVTVADTLGRLVVGARVTAGARSGRTRADGTLALRVQGRGPHVVVARAGRKVALVRVR